MKRPDVKSYMKYEAYIIDIEFEGKIYTIDAKSNSVNTYVYDIRDAATNQRMSISEELYNLLIESAHYIIDQGHRF